MRTHLRSLQHGTQIQHRHHAAQNFRIKDPQDHHLDNGFGPRNIRLGLLPPLRHAVRAIQLFLDSLYWWDWNLYQPRHHRQRNLCLLCCLVCCGLDTRTSSNLPRLEPANEPQNKAFRCSHSRSRSHVSTLGLPPTLQIPDLQHTRASTATIVRIPYVKDLSNQEDFLYATTDVALWSIAETGIGIAASSFATLRPVFRTFLSRSKLLGGSSSQNASNPWPASGHPGYIRSRSKGGLEEFGLRSDIGKNRGVTTVVEAGVDVERGDGKGVMRSISERRGSGGHLTSAPTAWNDSESRLTEASSEDSESWGAGIRKTTVSTQNVR
jgi:hypothetical protein